MILTLSNEETEVMRYMFRDSRVDSLPPQIKPVALQIKDALSNSRKVDAEQYKKITTAINPKWKDCKNCDE